MSAIARSPDLKQRLDHAVELIKKILHDDLAGFVYKRLRRRPVILPVVVEV